MPKVAEILYGSGFKESGPKFFKNEVHAVHVGSVHGIHLERQAMVKPVLERLRKTDLSKKVVPLANGFRKIEVKQMNSVLNAIMRELGQGDR